jgi:hypothetical protein
MKTNRKKKTTKQYKSKGKRKGRDDSNDYDAQSTDCDHIH